MGVMPKRGWHSLSMCTARTNGIVAQSFCPCNEKIMCNLNSSL